MQGLKYLTNLLYPEVYGDRMQACHLLDCHHQAVIQQQKTEMTKLRAKRDFLADEQEGRATTATVVSYHGARYLQFGFRS